MNGTMNRESGFVGYEYKDVTVNRALEPVYCDGYENFGWTYEDTGLAIGNPTAVTMKFKRDRKIRNKAELTRLQRQFDACASEITTLERSKVTGAATVAYIIGILGAAFMAGAVFAYLAGMIVLMVVLAVPGFVGFALPYFLFQKVRKDKAAKVAPLIDSKYDEMYSVCEKASGLLAHA